MAERRMFAKTIIDSDAFLDMPLSTQALYFHLAMRADDEGFVNNPKKIQRMIGASDDDCRILASKRFILTFQSGIIVIKHWKIHNYIQSDRFKETVYLEEKTMLALDDNKAYTERIQDVSTLDTQYSIGKDSIVKESIEEKGEQVATLSVKRFVKPTLEEVVAYCEERKNGISAQQFMDFYESKGWKVGNQPMKDWKACVRTWEQRHKNENKSTKVADASKYNREE